MGLKYNVPVKVGLFTAPPVALYRCWRGGVVCVPVNHNGGRVGTLICVADACRDSLARTALLGRKKVLR